MQLFKRQKFDKTDDNLEYTKQVLTQITCSHDTVNYNKELRRGHDTDRDEKPVYVVSDPVKDRVVYTGDSMFIPVNTRAENTDRLTARAGLNGVVLNGFDRARLDEYNHSLSDDSWDIWKQLNIYGQSLKNHDSDNATGVIDDPVIMVSGSMSLHNYRPDTKIPRNSLCVYMFPDPKRSQPFSANGYSTVYAMSRKVLEIAPMNIEKFRFFTGSTGILNAYHDATGLEAAKTRKRVTWDDTTKRFIYKEYTFPGTLRKTPDGTIRRDRDRVIREVAEVEGTSAVPIKKTSDDVVSSYFDYIKDVENRTGKIKLHVDATSFLVECNFVLENINYQGNDKMPSNIENEFWVQTVLVDGDGYNKLIRENESDRLNLCNLIMCNALNKNDAGERYNPNISKAIADRVLRSEDFDSSQLWRLLCCVLYAMIVKLFNPLSTKERQAEFQTIFLYFVNTKPLFIETSDMTRGLNVSKKALRTLIGGYLMDFEINLNERDRLIDDLHKSLKNIYIHRDNVPKLINFAEMLFRLYLSFGEFMDKVLKVRSKNESDDEQMQVVAEEKVDDKEEQIQVSDLKKLVVTDEMKKELVKNPDGEIISEADFLKVDLELDDPQDIPIEKKQDLVISKRSQAYPLILSYLKWKGVATEFNYKPTQRELDIISVFSNTEIFQKIYHEYVANGNQLDTPEMRELEKKYEQKFREYNFGLIVGYLNDMLNSVKRVFAGIEESKLLSRVEFDDFTELKYNSLNELENYLKDKITSAVDAEKVLYMIEKVDDMYSRMSANSDLPGLKLELKKGNNDDLNKQVLDRLDAIEQDLKKSNAVYENLISNVKDDASRQEIAETKNEVENKIVRIQNFREELDAELEKLQSEFKGHTKQLVDDIEKLKSENELLRGESKKKEKTGGYSIGGVVKSVWNMIPKWPTFQASKLEEEKTDSDLETSKLEEKKTDSDLETEYEALSDELEGIESSYLTGKSFFDIEPTVYKELSEKELLDLFFLKPKKEINFDIKYTKVDDWVLEPIEHEFKRELENLVFRFCGVQIEMGHSGCHGEHFHYPPIKHLFQVESK